MQRGPGRRGLFSLPAPWGRGCPGAGISPGPVRPGSVRRRRHLHGGRCGTGRGRVGAAPCPGGGWGGQAPLTAAGRAPHPPQLVPAPPLPRVPSAPAATLPGALRGSGPNQCGSHNAPRGARGSRSCCPLCGSAPRWEPAGSRLSSSSPHLAEPGPA